MECPKSLHHAQAPLIAVASLAAYLLFTLAYGVLNFKDCPEDAEALRQVKTFPNASGNTSDKCHFV
jgi:hypothetical protein